MKTPRDSWLLDSKRVKKESKEKKLRDKWILISQIKIKGQTQKTGRNGEYIAF